MVTSGSGSCQITICETNSHNRADQHVKKYNIVSELMQALIIVAKKTDKRME